MSFSSYRTYSFCEAHGKRVVDTHGAMSQGAHTDGERCNWKRGAFIGDKRIKCCREDAVQDYYFPETT